MDPVTLKFHTVFVDKNVNIIYICFLFRMRGNFQFVNQRISVYWYDRIQEGPELYMVDQGESNALFDMLGINI